MLFAKKTLLVLYFLLTCAHANESYDFSNTKAAGTLVIDCRDEQPVMLGVMQYQQSHLVFSPPGGWLNGGEHPKQGAVRETKEETGYTVIAEKVLGSPPMMFNVYMLVLATVDKSKSVSPNIQEVESVRWANPSDIPLEDWRFPNQRQWIIDLFLRYAPKNCD